MTIEHYEQLIDQNHQLIAEKQKLRQQLDEAEGRERLLKAELVSVGLNLDRVLERLRGLIAN